jgi:type II pantothenate kinase
MNPVPDNPLGLRRRRVMPLSVLAAPEAYRPCAWDLRRQPRRRRYWVGLIHRHFPGLLEAGVKEAVARGEAEASVRARARACEAAFYARLMTMAAAPHREPTLDLLALSSERERFLRRFGFADPYRLVKEREHARAMARLPGVLVALDRAAPAARPQRLVEGVLAGNLFDLGATSTASCHADGAAAPDFEATRRRLPPRPWLVDDTTAWSARFARGWRRAVLFVDNAGGDAVLGMLPLARELARRGTEVVLAANTTPALNDVTALEMEALLAAAAARDDVVARGRAAGLLRVRASGGAAALIDLTRLDGRLGDELAVRPPDLVVLEGMGRALESNYDARFTCDVLKIAMIKDAGVAEAMGGRLHDQVVRFEPGAG